MVKCMNWYFFPWRSERIPTPVFWPGEFHGLYNGTPLQYTCLENPMDGGAWEAAVLGVARSRTWLSDFTFTFHFHALEKEMAIHSSVLAWRIPGTGEPGGLPSMGSHRVGHDWSDLAAVAAAYSPWGHKEWDTTEQISLSLSYYWGELSTYLRKWMYSWPLNNMGLRDSTQSTNCV